MPWSLTWQQMDPHTYTKDQLRVFEKERLFELLFFYKYQV